LFQILGASTFSFLLEVAFGGEDTTSVAVLKKSPEIPLEDSKSAASQLHVVDLGDKSPFDVLHNYIHNSFAPFFRSFLNKKQKDSTSGTAADQEKRLGN
jgi:hypothetical protein